MRLPYRSSDSGPEDSPEPYFTEDPVCEACGKPCESRSWLASLEGMACTDCAEESEALNLAEKTCQSLHDAIIRSKSILQVRIAVMVHKASCPICGMRVVERRSAVRLGIPPVTKEAA